MCDIKLMKAVGSFPSILSRQRYSSGYQGGNLFEMAFPLALFMLPQHSSQIMGCCVKILSIPKEFNTWIEEKREFLKNKASNSAH